MPIPIDQQIESLVASHDWEMAQLHLGCSPFDDVDMENDDVEPDCLEENSWDE